MPPCEVNFFNCTFGAFALWYSGCTVIQSTATAYSCTVPFYHYYYSEVISRRILHYNLEKSMEKVTLVLVAAMIDKWCVHSAWNDLIMNLWKKVGGKKWRIRYKRGNMRSPLRRGDPSKLDHISTVAVLYFALLWTHLENKSVPARACYQLEWWINKGSALPCLCGAIQIYGERPIMQHCCTCGWQLGFTE